MSELLNVYYKNRKSKDVDSRQKYINKGNGMKRFNVYLHKMTIYFFKKEVLMLKIIKA